MEPGRWRPGPKEEGSIMRRLLLRFWQDESGATAIEYGLIAAAIAIAIILIINGLGINIAEKLTLLNASLK